MSNERLTHCYRLPDGMIANRIAFLLYYRLNLARAVNDSHIVTKDIYWAVDWYSHILSLYCMPLHVLIPCFVATNSAPNTDLFQWLTVSLTTIVLIPCLLRSGIMFESACSLEGCRDSHNSRSKGGIRDSMEKELVELQDDIWRIE